MGEGQFRRKAWTGLASLAVLTTLLFVHASTSTAHAQEQVPAPPGGCWGGALSADPLQCYALEEAQKQAVVEVEGVYDAGPILYIYFSFRREGFWWDDLEQLLREKGREFAENFPDRVSYGSFNVHSCSGRQGDEAYRNCIIDDTFEHGEISPWSSPYEVIDLASGGAEARHSKGGWASWRQLWPIGASGATGDFDVSGVDLTNIPEADCTASKGWADTKGCTEWKEFPGFGIAGLHIGGWADWSHLYVQVKASSDDDSRISAAKQEYLRHYALEDDYLTVIPVKYEFGELWKWTVILNRFAVSSGNGLGVKGARIGINRGAYDVTLYPVKDFLVADGDDRSTRRETIHVWATDAQRVATALPQLLPKLGIPVDAVGVVGQNNQERHIVVPEPLEIELSRIGADSSDVVAASNPSLNSGRPVGQSTFDFGLSLWSVASVGSILVLTILGSTALLLLRRRASR